jgi:hypothetical protein
MIIYHTTFHVDEDVVAESIAFLKQIYIPKATQSGLLHSPALHRVLQEDEEGASISVQFRVEDQKTLHRWMQHEGVGIQRELVARFGNKVAGFSTLLDEIKL